jgi:hypothetical protein
MLYTRTYIIKRALMEANRVPFQMTKLTETLFAHITPRTVSLSSVVSFDQTETLNH